jgi:hypothetical protein
MQWPARCGSRHLAEVQLPSGQYGYPGAPRNADDDADSKSDPDPPTDVDRDANRHTDFHPDSETNRNGKGDQDSEGDRNSYSVADLDADARTHEHTDHGADEHADADPVAHGHSDGNPNRYCDAERNAGDGPLRRGRLHGERSMSHRHLRPGNRPVLQSGEGRRGIVHRRQRLHADRRLQGGRVRWP